MRTSRWRLCGPIPAVPRSSREKLHPSSDVIGSRYKRIARGQLSQCPRRGTYVGRARPTLLVLESARDLQTPPSIYSHSAPLGLATAASCRPGCKVWDGAESGIDDGTQAVEWHNFGTEDCNGHQVLALDCDEPS